MLNRLSLSATIHCLTGVRDRRGAGDDPGDLVGLALLIAGAVAWPLNGWLISSGKGHAVVHARHGQAH